MTYNSCSTMKWNNGVSFPIGSGHPCIGCSEENFWDNGPSISGSAPSQFLESIPHRMPSARPSPSSPEPVWPLTSSPRAALGGVMKKITSPPAQPPPGPAKDDTKEGGN